MLGCREGEKTREGAGDKPIHGPRRGRINRRAGIFAARLTFVADNSQLVSVSSSEPYVSWRRLDSASLSHSCENEHRIPGQAGF